MTNFLDRPTYLSMRSRLLAERGYIEQEIQRLREEVDYLWRLGEPHEDVKRQLFDTYDAKHQNVAKLRSSTPNGARPTRLRAWQMQRRPFPTARNDWNASSARSRSAPKS